MKTSLSCLKPERLACVPLVAALTVVDRVLLVRGCCCNVWQGPELKKVTEHRQTEEIFEHGQ